ncbi:chorismate mutase [Actinocorallia sp. API 0066]|uniref:chorismate mutase n=1 Tax=Actinocorallia sp. API 0066 TaxID=2896846 RepID=UPI001E38E6C8|nr:chorismate mutase [Actinocorallia sp. API 0066]MCD0450832.1 chorismate mutase [Actinocorallia sp. API 0066]
MLPIDPETATLAQIRTAIDAIDAELAGLLERRAALAGRVQRLKPVGGHRGRDPEREAAIVDAMAPHAPSLSRDHLARIMNAVIEAGLDAADPARD